MTVAGTNLSSWNTLVMPTFLPIIPLLISTTNLQLDLDIHTLRQVKAHERLGYLWSGIGYLDQPLVNTHLKLLTRLFVHMWRPEHRDMLFSVGSGIGPETRAPACWMISTIFPAQMSSVL